MIPCMHLVARLTRFLEETPVDSFLTTYPRPRRSCDVLFDFLAIFFVPC